MSLTQTLERPIWPAIDTAPEESRPKPPAGWVARVVRGRPSDPAWVRPALLALLTGTAILYLVDLGSSGWANSFYSAAVQAGTKSWKAFFFGSSDASNFITVDKPPAALWVMELSARLFGVNTWSILVPQAVEGVASVGVLYLTVRRWFTPGAALLAGATLALTPVATLMFRFNNPDALLVLLLIGAAYATVRAVERGKTRWLVLAGSLVGIGFITKMMQAFILFPIIGVVYLVAGPPQLGRRLLQLVYAGVAMLVSAGWWVLAVQLTPAADRPYIGGSQDNSLFNLIFGYNGFGRLTGSETGSVGGTGVGSSQWGPTGWGRLFLPEMGGQISWLIPGSLIGLVAVLWLGRRDPRTDRTRAAFILFGGWLLLTGAIFSFAQGIIHPYYTVALAPAIGALVGMSASNLWKQRDKLVARLALALALVTSAMWAFVLLGRSPEWYPPLRFAILVVGCVAALGIAVLPRFRYAVVVAAIAGLAAVLAGPAAYAINTASTTHSGAIPSAGPSINDGQGGPGGMGGQGPGGNTGPGQRGGGFGQSAHGGPPSGFGSPGGLSPNAPAASNQGTFANRPGGGRQSAGGTGGGPGGGGGGFLNATTPSAQLVTVLKGDADKFTWVAATVDSNSAAGYQLATDDPVMAIGGFNGTDPTPTLAQFERYVRQGNIHYFIASSGQGIGQTGTSGTASQITSWVEAHFTATTVGGTTIYNVTTTAG